MNEQLKWQQPRYTPQKKTEAKKKKKRKNAYSSQDSAKFMVAKR